MTPVQERIPQRRKEGPQQGGGLVFWLMVGMGITAFAPCIILPEWRAYQLLRIAEQEQEHRLACLQRRVEHERRLLDAMRGDPAVVARLAQRDLRFRRQNEQFVMVDVPRAEPELDEPFEPKPVQPHPLVARAAARLPDLDYDRIFCDPQTRPIIMGMSLSLIVLAIILFGRGESGRVSSTPVPRHHAEGG
jgi:hypothetical protein